MTNGSRKSGAASLNIRRMGDSLNLIMRKNRSNLIPAVKTKTSRESQ